MPTATCRACTAARTPGSVISSPLRGPASSSPTRSGSPNGTASRTPTAPTSPRATGPTISASTSTRADTTRPTGARRSTSTATTSMPAARAAAPCSRTAPSCRSAADPSFFEIAGGAPLLVDAWNDVGGVQPYTVITQQQFDALNPVPTDGTMIQTDNGAVYVIAGGAPLYVSDLALFGTVQPVLVDIWDVQNAGSPGSGLNAAPSNGTFLSDDDRSELPRRRWRSDRRHDLEAVRRRPAVGDDRSMGHLQRLEPSHPPRLPAERRDGGRRPSVTGLLGIRPEEPLPRPAESRRGARRRPRPRAVLGHTLPSPGSRPHDAGAGQAGADEGGLPARQGARSPTDAAPAHAARDQAESRPRAQSTSPSTGLASRWAERPAGSARVRSTGRRSLPT